MTIRKRIVVQDYRVLIARAWDWLWANRYQGHSDDRFNDNFLTATDVHRRVRADAYEQLTGREYGSEGRDAWGAPVRCSITLEKVRSWLSSEVAAGRLTAYSPSGHRTCSGLRFRPAGVGLTEAEQRTVAAKKAEKERGPIVHVKRDDGDRLCAPATKPKRSMFSRGYGRKFLRFVSSYHPEATCKCCIARAAKEGRSTKYVLPVEVETEPS